jgi:beta-barrel assembly-enhancing protease
MENFAIKYFDGRSSAMHNGLLILEKNQWEIKLIDEGGLYNSVIWPVYQIKQAQYVGGSMIFKYGDFPQQTLECADDRLAVALKQKYPQLKFFENTSKWALSASLGIILAMAVGILVLGFAFYKYAIPPIAEAFAEKVPLEYEQKWGDMMLKNIIDPENNIGEFSFKKNDTLTQLANSFAQQIDFQSPYNLKITVVSSDQINAFALPGGNIVVFDALLKKLKTKEELAALLGHEAAHINQKHSLKNIFRSLSGYIFISLITNDINGISAVLFENANSIYNLGYSRELEAESDASAVKTLHHNQLNPNGLVGLFEALESAAKAEPYEILSTHPLTKDRKTFAQKNIIKNKVYPPNLSLEAAWAAVKNNLK